MLITILYFWPTSWKYITFCSNSNTLSIILKGFTALQTSGLFKNQKKTNLSLYYFITTVILPNINLERLELFRPWGIASEPVPFSWRRQAYMTLTLLTSKHSAHKPPGAKNCLNILKKLRVANQNDGYVFLHRSWKGFYISCATPIWRLFLFIIKLSENEIDFC